MSKRLDLTGKRFGRLIAVSFVGCEGKRSYWNVKCDCGNTDIARTDRLTNGTKMSCGCLRYEAQLKNFNRLQTPGMGVHFIGRDWPEK